MSAFLVPIDAPGLRAGTTVDSLGVRGLGWRDIDLKGVRVGADGLVGQEGDGFRIAMWALDGGRVAIAAQALGIGQAAFHEALTHANDRRSGGRSGGTRRCSG